ncbi:YIP1 family protein [bacterium]|nr:YIP1 family protein [bacterium]
MPDNHDEKEKELLENEEETQWEDAEMPSETEEDEPYGIMSRIIGVFIEPNKAFKHIGTKPEIWGAILFCLVVLIVASLFTMNEMVELTVNGTAEMLAEQGMEPSQIETAANVSGIMIRFNSIFQTLGILILWLIYALVAYIVGLFMGQDSNYKSSLAVIGYSSLPSILIKQGIIGTVVFLTGSWATMAEYQHAMMTSSFSLYTLFGNPEMNFNIQALLLAIDPFMFWGLFLMAVGFKYANNVKAAQGWRTAIIVTVIIIAAAIPLTVMGLSKMAAAN